MQRSPLLCLAAALGPCLALPTTALAADGEDAPLALDPADAGARAASGGGGLVRTIVGLAVVLAVIYGIHWVLKQVKASREDRHAGTGLGSLATLPLGPNRSLHLVRAGTEVVLVGVGEGGVTPIRVYSEAEARELGLLGADADGDGDGDGSGGGVSLPALMDAGPETAAHKVGAALRRRGVRQMLDDLRARTVIR